MLQPSELPIQPGQAIPEALTFENFSLVLAGKEVLQFEDFRYKVKAEYKFNKGKGGHIVSYSVVGYERESSAKVAVEELKELITLCAAYGGDITQMPPLPAVGTAQSSNGLLKIMIPLMRIMEYEIAFEKGKEQTIVSVPLAVLSYPIITYA